SRRRHTRFSPDWSSDVCSSDLSRLSQVRQHGPLVLPLLHTPAKLSNNHHWDVEVSRHVFERTADLFNLMMAALFGIDRSNQSQIVNEHNVVMIRFLRYIAPHSRPHVLHCILVSDVEAEFF